MRGSRGAVPWKERVEAIRELMAGKADIDQLAMRFGVRPETLVGWRDEALAAIESVFRKGPSPEARAQAKQSGALQKAFTDLAIRHELVPRAIKDRPSGPRRL